MKNIWNYALLALLLLLLSACESGAKFIVHNNSSYPVYAAVDSGTQVTIPAHSIHSFEVETKTQSILTGEVKRTVPVFIQGETFSLEDEYNSLWTDNTTITVKAGEDLHAYLAPNRASIKVTNISSRKITEARILKNAGIYPVPFASILEIMPGESKFMRVDYYTSNYQFFYQIEITTEDGVTYTYGDATTMLQKDQQYPIVFMLEDAK
jgi:uncharacterized protein YcfL